MHLHPLPVPWLNPAIWPAVSIKKIVTCLQNMVYFLLDSSPLYAPERRGEGGSQDFVSISIPQQQQQQQMQLQLTDQRDSYLDSRAEAIEGIEKTINELGSIFQQLTSMISAHDDLVRRIDYNVESVESNVTEGQRQLVRYMSSISSNRWLMAKIFMTVIFFFLLFVLFFA